MKKVRKLVGLTLLLFSLGLPCFAGDTQTPTANSSPPTQDGALDTLLTQEGLTETPLTLALELIQSLMALI